MQYGFNGSVQNSQSERERVQSWIRANTQQVWSVIIKGGTAAEGGQIQWKHAAPFIPVANFQLCKGSGPPKSSGDSEQWIGNVIPLIYISFQKAAKNQLF